MILYVAALLLFKFISILSGVSSIWSHVIAESINNTFLRKCNFLNIHQSDNVYHTHKHTCTRIFYWFFTLKLILITIPFWFDLHFLASNLHLQSHEIFLFIPLILWFPVIILSTFKFTSSVLFGLHILQDKSSGVLQLPLHLSKLTWMDNHKVYLDLNQ